MAAGEIALLVADAGDDGEAAVLDVDALGGLVVGDAAVRRDAAHVEVIGGNVLVAGVLEIAQRPDARQLVVIFALEAAGDEEHVDRRAWTADLDAACRL